MKHSRNQNPLETAETIAFRALEYIAADGARLSHFMEMTGASHDQLRTLAGNHELLAGALRVLLHDESALLTFCSNASIEPDIVQHALHTLEEHIAC